MRERTGIRVSFASNDNGGRSRCPVVRRALHEAWWCLFPVVVAGCQATKPKADLAWFPAPPARAHVVHLKSFNRLGELVPRRVSLLARLTGTVEEPFADQPAGLAYRDDHLYLCDAGASVVHVWNLRDGGARVLGADANGLRKPVAVAADPDGGVFVADTGRGEVVVFDANGATVRTLRRPESEAYKPVALWLDEQSVFVADAAAHRIDVFDSDGAYQRSLAEADDENRFYFPMGVCTDAGGRLYVADSMNGRVHVFDGGGSLVRTIGQRGNRYGDVGQPRHLAVGPDGVLFVTDVEFAHVHLFDEEGRLLMLLGGPDVPLGGTPLPAGVAVATSVPPTIVALVPPGFFAHYYLFVSNRVGAKRVSLYAVGSQGS